MAANDSFRKFQDFCEARGLDRPSPPAPGTLSPSWALKAGGSSRLAEIALLLGLRNAGEVGALVTDAEQAAALFEFVSAEHRGGGTFSTGQLQYELRMLFGQAGRGGVSLDAWEQLRERRRITCWMSADQDIRIRHAAVDARENLSDFFLNAVEVRLAQAAAVAKPLTMAKK